MAWNIERRATDEDAIRLERAAQAFIRRNDLIPDLHAPHYYPAGNSAVGDLEDVLEAAISGDYPFDASEGRRLRRNWNRCVRRALRSETATGIAWGYVGYHVD